MVTYKKGRGGNWMEKTDVDETALSIHFIYFT